MFDNHSSIHDLIISRQHEVDGFGISEMLLRQDALGESMGIVFRQDRHGLLHDDGTVVKMLDHRGDRQPVASVSFLNAKANKLLGPDGREPTFETVLRTMYEAGFRGDVYTSPAAWSTHVGVFPSYPFPEGLERMRAGSS